MHAAVASLGRNRPALVQGVQRLQECDVPDIVKKRYAEGMTEGERHEKRQLLFAEVYRWLHVVVKHLVRDEDVGDTCHTLTDYILTNITPFVLDFLTSPIVAFEVIRSIWASFEVRPNLERLAAACPAACPVRPLLLKQVRSHPPTSAPHTRDPPRYVPVTAPGITGLPQALHAPRGLPCDAIGHQRPLQLQFGRSPTAHTSFPFGDNSRGRFQPMRS